MPIDPHSTNLGRRNLLRRGLALAGIVAAAPAAARQSIGDIGRLLGQKLPEPLRAALPPELGEATRIAGELVQLEQQAHALRLPRSALDFGSGTIPSDPGRLYEAAMPRLVALVDQGLRGSPTLADQAGSLLGRLHRTQYDPPDAWFSEKSVATPLVSDPSGGVVHLPEIPVRPLRLADPPGDDVAQAMPPLTLPGADLPEVETPTERPNTSLRFDDISSEYANWFASAQIRPEHRESADWHLTMMRQSRERYEAVGRRLAVPWYFIATIHGLEASFNFRAHLHNGDYPLNRRTHQVPAGRPLVWLPPSDWESSASDALRLMGFTGQVDWSLPRTLYRLEAYNGFGYRRAGRVSPYLWSFSSHYDRGKFVADGHFDPRARSQQCGAAVMLKVLADAGGLDAA